jgi:hypothetical protein
MDALAGLIVQQVEGSWTWDCGFASCYVRLDHQGAAEFPWVRGFLSGGRANPPSA